MSNRFCVILNQGNNILTISKQSHDKLHKLRQGHLLVGENTPYKSFSQDDEYWHIIGHIDNLPLLNYLLFSYYPSAGHSISEEIICIAIKRYGMKIIELLKGDFCVIYEDAEGNLTLVTEEDSSHLVTETTGSAGEGAVEDISGRRLPAQGMRTDSLPRGYSKRYADLETNRGACQCPEGEYNIQRRISITRWQDNNLQFIQSFRCPLYTALPEENLEERGDDFSNNITYSR